MTTQQFLFLTTRVVCGVAQKTKKYEHAAKMEEMTEEQKAKRAEEEFKKSRRQKSSGRTVLHHSGCKKHFC